MPARGKMVFGVGSGALVLLVVAMVLLFDIQLQPSGWLRQVTGRPAVVAALPTPPPITGQVLGASVLPDQGYTVPVTWGDVGVKLVSAGAIDLAQYQKIYTDPAGQALLSFLTPSQDRPITISRETAYFWVNTLWALGLTQRSDVLGRGVMGTQYKEELGNFASTAGWTLGTKDAVSLYNSTEILRLSAEEQERVRVIADGVFRPCCGNPTSFPDCNHGMAALGLIELMVDQGFSNEDIYAAALAFNSYWFPQTYVELAYYFQAREGTAWADVDPKRVLSAQFSSSPGYAAIKQQIGEVPGMPEIGGSCGA